MLGVVGYSVGVEAADGVMGASVGFRDMQLRSVGGELGIQAQQEDTHKRTHVSVSSGLSLAFKAPSTKLRVYDRFFMPRRVVESTSIVYGLV